MNKENTEVQKQYEKGKKVYSLSAVVNEDYEGILMLFARQVIDTESMMSFPSSVPIDIVDIDNLVRNEVEYTGHQFLMTKEDLLELRECIDSVLNDKCEYKY